MQSCPRIQRASQVDRGFGLGAVEENGIIPGWGGMRVMWERRKSVVSGIRVDGTEWDHGQRASTRIRG